MSECNGATASLTFIITAGAQTETAALQHNTANTEREQRQREREKKRKGEEEREKTMRKQTDRQIDRIMDG